MGLLIRFRAIPRRYFLVAGLGFFIVLVALVLWPRQITLSYERATCITQPLLAPNLLDTHSDQFKAEASSVVKLGTLSVAAGGVCFKPLKAPKGGDHQIALAIPGIPFVSKQVTVHVPEYPLASVAPLKKPIPVSKRLIVPLSSHDVVFSYRLLLDDKTASCKNDNVGINCGLPGLDLKQGTQYELQLDRYFNNKKVATIIKEPITTLSAVTFLAASIKSGETVYAKPKSIAIQLDKQVDAIDLTLMQINGDKKETIPAEKTVKGKEVTLVWQDDLPRQKAYEVVVERAVAADGSTLVDPIIIPFKTSGGPLVSAINVGTYKVPLGASATLTFDQPLSEKQDIGKSIVVTGGAKITSRQGSQVTISFAGVPRCGDVTIKVTNELQSSYDIVGGSAWQYTTRTICQIVGSIGTSVKGRAISSFSFGTGAKTIVYTGAIHGDEASTRSLMLRWIDTLEANARSIPADKTVVVIPTINPDGLAAGTRTNARNVDLNRNFNTSDWKKDITTVTNKPFPGGGGQSPLSEPESQAVANYIGNLRPALVLSYHSIGGLVAANQAGSSSQLSHTYSGLSGYSNATGSITTFEYSVSGTADDYYGEKLGVASILIELGSHTYHQFEQNQRAMWAMLR